MHKVWQMFWYVFYVAVAKHLPYSYARVWGRPARWIRLACCSRFLAGCGNHVNIERGATFGRRVWVGNYSDLGIDCKINGELHIGHNTFMGPQVMVYTTNHEFIRTDVPMMYQALTKERPVVIGNDVWIGARVILLPGVHVFDHAIIGAGAVVTKDVPEWAIVGGNPARIIRYRRGSEPDGADRSNCEVLVQT